MWCRGFSGFGVGLCHLAETSPCLLWGPRVVGASHLPLGWRVTWAAPRAPRTRQKMVSARTAPTLSSEMLCVVWLQICKKAKTGNAKIPLNT